jgi:alkylhydroperoxidase family enzyme
VESARSGRFEIFAEKDREALRFAEALTKDSNGIGEEPFASLRRHFDEGEVVEIAAVAGLFNYLNRFNNALCVEPTR